jgi:hypothetical protein
MSLARRLEIISAILIDQDVGVLSMIAGEEKHEHWELIYAGGDELL